jgi:hypothetical protein
MQRKHRRANLQRVVLGWKYRRKVFPDNMLRHILLVLCKMLT